MMRCFPLGSRLHWRALSDEACDRVRGFDVFTAGFLPAEIERVDCKGKFIYMVCESKLTGQYGSIWSTLGMSGRWGLQRTGHSRVKFELSQSEGTVSLGGAAVELYYTDPRNFGTMTFSLSETELQGKLATIGPAYLTGDVTALEFVKLGEDSAASRR
jgi:formamidopyrimidine-DNA glycosylase